MENTSEFGHKLYELWKKAVEIYKNGNRTPSTFFNEEETNFLKANGISAQELYDFAEDFNNDKEPDFAVVLLIQEVRRAYFLEEQKAILSKNILNMETVPAKKDTIEDIAWFPRIIAKAKAKLHGELTPDLMYCCPGDRVFLKENHIHPAEFLHALWFYEKENDDKGFIKWFMHRRKMRTNFLTTIKSLFH